jgi:hypothetical protein
MPATAPTSLPARSASAPATDRRVALRPRRWLAALRVAVVALSALGGVARVQAQPSLPYTPSVPARHAIQFLIDDAGLALGATQWPLPSAAVQAALDALPVGSLSPAARRAQALVRAELQRRSRAAVQATAALRRATPVGFGDAAEPGSSLAGRAPAWSLADQRLLVQLGVRAHGAPVLGDVPADTTSTARAQLRLDGSAAVAEAGGVAWQAWSRRSWWGPGWQNSLVLGHNAPDLIGFGAQRAAAGASDSPWLAWLGPWNAEFFVARLQGHAAPAHPWLIGNRLTFRPAAWAEVGLTRTAQWGGAGRSQSIGSFVSMLTGSGTNADTVAQRARDPGNQMAGFDLRLRCPAGWPCAAYTQLIGEDMAGIWPSKYLGLYGLETWSADGQQRWFAEYVDSSCGSTPGGERALGCAYRNGQYLEGYAQSRRWLGSSWGPDARVLTLGWLHAPSGGSLRLHTGRIDLLGATAFGVAPGAVTATSAGAQARVAVVQLQRDWAWAGGSLTPQLGWQRLSAQGGQADRQWQLGLQWTVPLGGEAVGAP